MVSSSDLETVFQKKYGEPQSTGWSPKRRFRFGYYLPADVYEAAVAKYVADSCTWLDVGGGRAIFPDNPALATELVARCAKVVAVDPSDNVHENTFVNERVQVHLEDYKPSTQFDLATLRMVVEHVSQPKLFVEALARLVRSAGNVVLFTVNRWAPVSLVSRTLPFNFHHPIKRFFWGGEKEDTFPVHYKMNTRVALKRLFEEAGFVEESFCKLDDLSVFGRYGWINYLDLCVWKALHSLGLSYPENCLLAVYRKR
jgi:2-polyprenyl-3-methyl-5-hydroxy-6-metoxy-1,4-benzoquinol methylase